MTTNSIDVFIYLYKGKYVKELLESIFTNQSGKNKINVWLVDQHPINREKVLVEKYKIRYSHIFWDWQISPCKYKNDAIVSSRSKYLMLISENISLSKNWDEDLVNFVDDKDIIVSGNKEIKILNKNLFHIDKEFSEIENFTLNNFISREMIFAKSSVFRTVNYPSYLKYNGEEEVLSLLYFINNIDIFAAPTELYNLLDQSPLEKYYSPFSINHNYNEAISLFKDNKNKYVDISNNTEKINNFYKYHNFDFNLLKKLPFEANDVSYNPESLNFNKVDARKFVARTRAIH